MFDKLNLHEGLMSRMNRKYNSEIVEQPKKEVMNYFKKEIVKKKEVPLNDFSKKLKFANKRG